jgi:hypothetical protein
MLRAALAAFVLLLAPAVGAQERHNLRDEPIVRAAANVLIQTLAPSGQGDWRYDWGAVSSRASRFVHWHIFEPDPRDRPADATVRRNGWIEAPGKQIGVSVFGGDRRVTMLSMEYHEFHNLDLLEALAAEGAQVSFQADYESHSEYIITPPGREAGLLTMRRVCTSPRSAAAQRCHNEAELTFAPFECLFRRR